jgi:arginase family enzyme
VSAIMNKLHYATAKDYENSACVVFGANTKNAGTAPTFHQANSYSYFSADVIRQADNKLFSLPENFKLGNQLWDDGNINFENNLKVEIEKVSNHFQKILQAKKIPICLGGDHIIKYAALLAINNIFKDDVGIVYVDAHPDCEQQAELNYASILHHSFQLSHLKPKQVMLVGIRQFTENEVQSLTKLNTIGIIKGLDFCSLGIHEILNKIIDHFTGLKYLYFSIDLDGLSPCSAPAVESPYPGGPTLNELLFLIQHLRSRFEYIGMDISEHIPEADKDHRTALAAVRIFK